MIPPFVIEQVFNAPIQNVWHILTDTPEMKEWYFPALLKFEPIIGSEFQFINDGAAYQKEWKVTDVIAGRKLSHSWSYKGYTGSSEVTFELLEEGPKTRLKLTHTGIESFPDDPHFARHRFEDGWKRIIGSNLKQRVERNEF